MSHQDSKASKRLDRVRDLFILGCYTGLRFSDFSQLKAENIIKHKKVPMISITTQKTGEKVVIPVNQRVMEILEKYIAYLPSLHPTRK